jgi:hypothetical protein
MKKLCYFLFIRGAEIIFLKKPNFYTCLFYFVYSIFVRLEYSIFKTFILISLFSFAIAFYFIFFVFILKSEKFANFWCKHFKANLKPIVFNSLVGNPSFHEFVAALGALGAPAVKLLAKAAGGHVVLAGGGFVLADHAFHESGAKAVLDTKIFLIGEQMKYDFAVKNNTSFNPGASPSLTKSLLKTLVEKTGSK